MVVLFMIGLYGARTASRSLPTNAGEAVNETRAPFMGQDSVKELQLVFIASGGCRACADPLLPALVREAEEHFKGVADSVGVALATVGIGVDASPAVGLEQLNRFGSFDEVTVGRRWDNLGVFEYIWETHPGQPAVPQLLLLTRTVRGTSSRPMLSTSSLVRRVVGLNELFRWREADFPVPEEFAQPGS